MIIENKRKQIHIIIAIAATLIFIGLIIVMIFPKFQGSAVSERDIIESMLSKTYTGKITGKDYAIIKRFIEKPGKDQIVTWGAKYIQALYTGKYNEFLSEFNGWKPEDLARMPDISLMKDLVTLKNNQPIIEREYSFSQIYLKPNLFEYFIRMKYTDPGYMEQNPDIYISLKQMGIYFHDHDLLFLGEQVFNVLEQLPEFADPEVMGWHGSILTKVALTVTSPVDKVDYVVKGTKLLDKAVYLKPKNIVVRIIRINNYLSLPNFFQKSSIAVKDVIYLASIYQTDGDVEVVEGYKKVRTEKISKDLLVNTIKFAIGNPNISNEQRDKLQQLLSQVK